MVTSKLTKNIADSKVLNEVPQIVLKITPDSRFVQVEAGRSGAAGSLATMMSPMNFGRQTSVMSHDCIEIRVDFEKLDESLN